MIIERCDVIAELEKLVETKLNLLRPVESTWQPSDLVPNMGEDWVAEVGRFRQGAQQLSDELLVVLVGTMVTEEALPSYQTFLNRMDGLKDITGTSSNPWAVWSRGWTAEENRHGDLLNRYMYLSGRVDMRSVEVTIQHLIRNGFDPGHCNDTYNGLIYTSFQERATRISHARIGQLSRQAGDENLSKICAIIAGDEARHEEAYKCFMGRVFEVDPNGAMLAFNQMIDHRIIMPASLMSDGSENDIYACFANVAQKLGVYTMSDYVDIMDHLIDTWNVSRITGLSGPAAAAQNRICRLPEVYRRRMLGKKASSPAPAAPIPFRWIYNRTL